MQTKRYQNSLCGTRGTWLHKFRIMKQTQMGVLERCERCGLTKHFSNQIKNHIYMSWHIRSALQSWEPLFNREYPQNS